MGLQLLSKPVNEPVTLDEVLAHCRVTTDLEDGLIQGYAVAARELVENDTGRALITQRWRYTVDMGWPTVKASGRDADDVFDTSGAGRSGRRKRIVMPRPPFQSIDAFNYVAWGGSAAALDPSQYISYLSDTGEQYVEPAYNVVWPMLQRQPACITLDVTCGYGDDPGDVPEVLRHAIKMQAGYWFEYRVPIAEARSVTELSENFASLVQRYRMLY